MREKKIRDFGTSELDRVFKNCATPIGCKRGVRIMIDEGLTIDEVYPRAGDKNEHFQR